MRKTDAGRKSYLARSRARVGRLRKLWRCYDPPNAAPVEAASGVRWRAEPQNETCKYSIVYAEGELITGHFPEHLRNLGFMRDESGQFQLAELVRDCLGGTHQAQRGEKLAA